VLLYAKKYGFSDKVIAHRWGMTEDDIYHYVFDKYQKYLSAI